MNLDLGTFSLRAPQASDAPSLSRHANNRNVSRNLRNAFPSPTASRTRSSSAGFTREGVLRSSVLKDGVLADSSVYACLR